MDEPYDGEVELLGGPLDGQTMSAQLPAGEDQLYFDVAAYPMPIPVFPRQVVPGQRLYVYEVFDDKVVDGHVRRRYRFLSTVETTDG